MSHVIPPYPSVPSPTWCAGETPEDRARYEARQQATPDDRVEFARSFAGTVWDGKVVCRDTMHRWLTTDPA